MLTTIFGNRDPSKKRTALLRLKQDLVYSESNFNLIADKAKELSLGEFIWILNAGPGALSDESKEEAPLMYLLEDDFSLCRGCQNSTGVACALFHNPKAKPAPDLSIAELGWASAWPEGSTEPLDLCPIVQRLLKMTDTGAEKRFYWLYFRLALGSPLQSVGLTQYVYRELSGRIGGESWLDDARWILLQNIFGLPALIPQVLLNFVPISHLAEGDPDKDYFDSHTGWVDFMYFKRDGQRHLIHIDGPYHHVQEQEYTKVLRRDRTERRLGYGVHRFSNMEVSQAKDFLAFAWELFW